MNDLENQPNERLGYMRLRQILKLIPVSEATWWRGCQTGRFPQPYKLAPRVTAWKVVDIYDCLKKFKASAR